MAKTKEQKIAELNATPTSAFFTEEAKQKRLAELNGDGKSGMDDRDKALTEQYREYMRKNPNATADQVLLATTGMMAPEGVGAGKSNYKAFIDMGRAVQDQQAKDEQAALAPQDTFDASLREIARARTARQMRMTNGRSGSALGIV